MESDISFVKVPLIYEQNYNYTNILLIDDTVQDYQTIVDSVNSNTMSIVYSYFSTKEELSNVLSNFTTISRIGFAFSCNPNNCPVIFLDNKPLFSFEYENVDNNSENLLFLINIIQKYNIINVDYLACNTLNYPQWNNYYNILKNTIVNDLNNEETNVIIGASNDATGNIKYGGDWILENTLENIEYIYFTQNINYYEYLLDNATWLVSNSNSKTAGMVTMYDSVTTKNIMFVSSGYSFWGFGCNFPPTTGTNNWNNGSEFGITASPFVYGMTVFTSSFTNTATNKKFVIAALSTGSIGYFYNFVLNQNTGTTTGGLGGSISTNATWLATGATMATTTNLALYNNRLFYSLPNGNIGTALITDATVPTIGTNNVAYINTTLLSSSTTLYPIGLTTDTNGYLYAVLGNVTSAATTGVIQVINVQSTPTLAYTISLSAANITTWGNPYALIWNSNNLYIGTSIGVANSATAGTIVLCNTLSGISSTVTSTLAAYKTGTKSIGAMAITGSSLYVSSLNSGNSTVSQYDITVTNTKGFYNKITDIVGNFSSITQLTSFPTFNGISNFSTKYCINNSGVNVDLALLYALNSAPITASYNTSMYTYVGGTKYDLSSLFAPVPTPVITSSTITFTGATVLTNTTSNNSGLGVNSNTTYRSDNQASATTTGTLYKFVSSGSFSMNSGSAATKCCAVIIGPGGYGMRRIGGAAGSGGCGILATFTLINGVTYNITINAGTNSTSNGTSVAGSSAIISSEGSPTVSLTAMGALGPYNSGGTTSTGGTSIIGSSNTAIYKSNNGSNPTGVDGYTFVNTDVTPNINSTSFTDMSTTIGSNNQSSFSNYAIPSGYTSFGFGSSAGINSGAGGGGGIYNKGGTTPGTSPNVTGNNGGNGIGYGNGGGITASTATVGGTGGPGVVYIYFNNKL